MERKQVAYSGEILTGSYSDIINRSDRPGERNLCAFDLCGFDSRRFEAQELRVQIPSGPIGPVVLTVNTLGVGQPYPLKFTRY